MFKFGRKSLQLDDRAEVINKPSSSFSFSALISPKQENSHSNQNSDKKQSSTDEIAQKFGKKSLPPDFAEKLLNLEIELELNENIQIDIITDLISQYMLGVEYYESIKDRRHVYFQRKLNQIMTKPAVLITTTPSKPIETKQDIPPMRMSIQKKEFEDQQKKLQLDLIYDEQNSQQAQVQELVQNHSNKAKKIEDFIQHHITQQDDSFKKRLERRKTNTGMTKSSSQPFLVPVDPSISEFNHNPQSTSPTLKQKQTNDVSIIKEEEEDEQQNRKISGYFKRSKAQPQIQFQEQNETNNTQNNKSLVRKQDKA